MAEFGGDAAVEQLYDELLARTVAVATFAPSISELARNTTVRHHLAGSAWEAVRELHCDPRPPTSTLSRLLWPNGTEPCPTHPWWSTPLGALLRSGATQDETSGDATTARRAARAITTPSGPGAAPDYDDFAGAEMELSTSAGAATLQVDGGAGRRE
jgi:hypothetical protein